jgi:hypothetical protein
MNIKDIASGALQVLKTVAPTIADTLAGPFAPLVDPVVRAIFGTTDPKQVSAALLNATPDQILALRQADDAHAEKLVQLGIDRDKLAFDNIANARAREIALHDSTPKYLAYLITFGFFGTLAYLIIYGKPTTGGDVMLVMVGSLGTAWSGIVSYYFGSSAGSAAKTDTINKIAESTK